MNPEIAAVMTGPRKITLLRDGKSAFVEIEPLRFFPINRRYLDGRHYVGRKAR